MELAAESAPASAPSSKLSGERCCLHCRRELFAPPRALWAICLGCRRRISIQHYRLTGAMESGEISTAGRIIVEADAQIQADLTAAKLVLKGRVMGRLAAYDCVIEKTAMVAGILLCNSLKIEPGAIVEAQVERWEDLEAGDVQVPTAE